jgi:hypothetical protein
MPGASVKRRPPLAVIVAASTMAVYLAAALSFGIYNTVRRCRAAVATAGEPPAAMRARVFGRRYNAAVERIRSLIPEDEPYFLSGKADGAIVWVRYDLLPRRAVRQEALAASPGDCWLGQIRWSVLALGFGRPPLLLERRAGVPPGCPAAPWRRAAAAGNTAPPDGQRH